MMKHLTAAAREALADFAQRAQGGGDHGAAQDAGSGHGVSPVVVRREGKRKGVRLQPM